MNIHYPRVAALRVADLRGIRIRYLELLRSVRNPLANESIYQAEIYTLEMLLFAKAEELVQTDNKIYIYDSRKSIAIILRLGIAT